MEREWLGRARPKCTATVKCKSCRAPVLWVTWPSTSKRMPLNSPADNRPVSEGGGNIVVTIVGGLHGKLTAQFFRADVHGAARNRYTSHLGNCGQADQWRRQ